MVDFMRDYSLGRIRSKLILLYLLNTLDMLCTLVLLNLGGFRELNPLMNQIIGNLPVALFVKLIIPGGVLLILFGRFRRAYESELRGPNRIINAMVGGYMLVNVCHLMMFLSAAVR